MPRASATTRPASAVPRPPQKRPGHFHNATGRASVVADFEDREKRLLRNFDLTELFEALLAFALLSPQLSLAGDVAAVAFGCHVLPQSGDRLTGDDAGADRRLNRN